MSVPEFADGDALTADQLDGLNRRSVQVFASAAARGAAHADPTGGEVCWLVAEGVMEMWSSAASQWQRVWEPAPDLSACCPPAYFGPIPPRPARDDESGCWSIEAVWEARRRGDWA